MIIEDTDKQIRVIPDEWIVIELGKIFSWSSGKSRPKDTVKVKTDESPIPVYGGNGILGYSSQKLFDESKLILGRVGEYCGCSHLTEKQSWISDNALYAKNILIDISLFYFKFYLDYLDLNRYANKNGQPLITQGNINRIKIVLPPITEQSNIAHILSLIESTIQKQEKIISTTTELKNALMKKLFTEGMNGEPLKETEIGLIPESWVVVKIGSFGKCVTGTTPKTAVRAYYVNPKYDFIAPADIGETKFVYNSIKQISEAGINVVRHLPPNAVLCVCIGSTIGKVGLTVKEKSATNQQLNSIICNDDYDPQFIYYLLNYYSSYWRTFSTPSPVPILSKGTFEQIDIRVTKNKEEQTSIVKTLSACDAKIEFHKNKKQTLKSLFSSSLHQLMTGKVRVKDVVKKVVQVVN